MFSSQMRLLDLNGTEINDDELDAITSCINDIEEIALRNSSRGPCVSVQGFRKLAEAIKNKNYPVIKIRFCLVCLFYSTLSSYHEKATVVLHF